MVLFSVTTLVVLLLCGGPMPAYAAKIKVVTTLTDLADFAREVGGDLVEVHSLATGVEDTHGVPMKPSFVPIMNKADLLVLVGFDCEHAFLPALAGGEQEPAHSVGQARLRGLLEGHRAQRCAEIDRSLRGRRPSLRQPALHARPGVGKDRDRKHLQRPGGVRPAVSRREFTRNRDAYLARLDAKIAEWEKETVPLKGVKFVSYHEHWPYFAERFGMDLFRDDRA